MRARPTLQLLSRASVKIAQTNRFLSNLRPKSLTELYQNPKIKAAMEKERVSEFSLTAANPNPWYIEYFAANKNVYAAYQNGHLSFSDYAFSTKDFQNRIIWFLTNFKNTDIALSKQYINLKRDVTHLPFGNFDLFNEKFCLYLLNTQKISIPDYIARQKMGDLYALSRLFLVKNIDLLISSNILSLDKTLTLDHQQLDDLTELLSGCGSVDNYNHWVESKPEWDIQNWISNNYITLHQFLQCEPYERRAYLCFMYCNPRPCDNFRHRQLI